MINIVKKELEFDDELYEEKILDNDDIDTIRNEYSKDDDLER